jgi:hypothetical protein
MALSGIRALVFDVFGTVVDWRSTVIAEGRALAARQGASGAQAGACGEPSAGVAQAWSQVDWGAFADAWRAHGCHGDCEAYLSPNPPAPYSGRMLCRWIGGDSPVRWAVAPPTPATLCSRLK